MVGLNVCEGLRGAALVPKWEAVWMCDGMLLTHIDMVSECARGCRLGWLTLKLTVCVCVCLV